MMFVSCIVNFMWICVCCWPLLATWDDGMEIEIGRKVDSYDGKFKDTSKQFQI